MKTLLKDKVVVITGSSRGIGRAIAEGCARAGASVVISARSGSGISRCVEEMQHAGILHGTKRSFKKRDLKIARWYYKQLCKSFKNGIVVWNGSSKSSLGRWD